MANIPRWLGGAITEAALAATPPDATAAALVPHQTGIASPWADTSHLEQVVWADILGSEFRGLTRADCMAIPALARQRHLMCGVAARCTLRLMTGSTPAADQPRWLTAGAGAMSAYHRMLWTVDDLIWGPFSVWTVSRTRDGVVDPELPPIRIPVDRWETDEADRLLIDGELADEDEVIVIPGPHEGLLNFGAPALRRTIDNLDAAATAARNPAAYLEIHYTGTEPITPEQKETLLNDWAAARRGERGGVAFTGPNLEIREHGTHEAHLLIEGRNADAVDVSRLVSSPAAMADATSAGASLTYETTEGRGLQFLDYGAALYMDSIAARLSMDDCVPAGSRVAFDISNATVFTPTPGAGMEE